MEIIIAILLFVISIDISNIHSAIKDLSNTIRIEKLEKEIFESEESK